jgi:hypothetical protein
VPKSTLHPLICRYQELDHFGVHLFLGAYRADLRKQFLKRGGDFADDLDSRSA